MKKFVFVLTLVAVASLSFCQNPVGAWNGKLNVNTATMPKASTPEQQKMIDKFLVQDEKMIREQHKVHHDETALINVSKQAAQQLAEVFKADRV